MAHCWASSCTVGAALKACPPSAPGNQKRSGVSWRARSVAALSCRRASAPPRPTPIGVFPRELPPPLPRPEGMSEALLEIDGSFGEGGGQILRTSLALSLLTGKPFRLFHVRARRAKPGLHAQHLTGVRAAATVGAAKLRGASLRSTDLTFEPGPRTPGRYRFH